MVLILFFQQLHLQVEVVAVAAAVLQVTKVAMVVLAAVVELMVVLEQFLEVLALQTKVLPVELDSLHRPNEVAVAVVVQVR